MAFKHSTNKLFTTKYGEPYLWGSGDVTTIPSNESKILASDGAEFDYFGASVAIGNGRIVVGAAFDDDNGSNSGSAYIFDLNGTQLAKIDASDGAANDQFGNSVAIGNGRIVVGSHQDEDNGSTSGSAYIFDLDGTQLAKITASDGAAGDRFGYSVAIGSGRIVVGAYGDDDNGTSSGSAYIFDLDGTQLAKITASDGAAYDRFGHSVAIGNGRIVVGAEGAGGYDINQGSAYIFDLDGTQLAKITASDGAVQDRFGCSVAVGNGRIVVGASGDDIDDVTINGGINYNVGSAYIYDLDGNFLTKILSSDETPGGLFGDSVAVGNGRIVVGVPYDNSNQGSAYIFDLDGNELAKITASDGAAGDAFGESVATGNGHIVVTAYQDSDNGTYSGSAYIYETPRVYTPYDLIYNEV
jgi:hypothetical protein